MLAAVEVYEVLAVRTGDEGSVDTVDVGVPPAEDAAAELEALGTADLGPPEVEQVVVE